MGCIVAGGLFVPNRVYWRPGVCFSHPVYQRLGRAPSRTPGPLGGSGRASFRPDPRRSRDPASRGGGLRTPQAPRWHPAGTPRARGAALGEAGRGGTAGRRPGARPSPILRSPPLVPLRPAGQYPTARHTPAQAPAPEPAPRTRLPEREFSVRDRAGRAEHPAPCAPWGARRLPENEPAIGGSLLSSYGQVFVSFRFVLPVWRYYLWV